VDKKIAIRLNPEKKPNSFLFRFFDPFAILNNFVVLMNAMWHVSKAEHSFALWLLAL